MADDYFDMKLAWNSDVGNVVPGAAAQVYAITDTSFTTPLEITDLGGIPLGSLVASISGIYPPFKVVSGDLKVMAKSGSMITPITSVDGSRGAPGEPGPPGVGLPDAGALPDGYVPVVASGEWSAAPGGGGGGGGTNDVLNVFWVEGSGWPTQPASAPAGVKLRQFWGSATKYTGPTWAGVRDVYYTPGA